jgi:hypothetical protein
MAVIRVDFPVKKAKDIHRILDSAQVVKRLLKFPTRFSKSIQAQLDKRGGETELWVALETLYEFAAALGEEPCEIVLGIERENAESDG